MRSFRTFRCPDCLPDVSEPAQRLDAGDCCRCASTFSVPCPRIVLKRTYLVELEKFLHDRGPVSFFQFQLRSSADSLLNNTTGLGRLRIAGWDSCNQLARSPPPPHDVSRLRRSAADLPILEAGRKEIVHRLARGEPSWSQPRANEAHVSGRDLRLFLVLDVVLSECSVARAASRPGMTQSAVRHSLRALRLRLDDPLLVRTGNGLEPTPLAQSLRPCRPAIQ